MKTSRRNLSWSSLRLSQHLKCWPINDCISYSSEMLIKLPCASVHITQKHACEHTLSVCRIRDGCTVYVPPHPRHGGTVGGCRCMKITVGHCSIQGHPVCLKCLGIGIHIPRKKRVFVGLFAFHIFRIGWKSQDLCISRDPFPLGWVFREGRHSVPGAFCVGYLSKDCFWHPCTQLLLYKLELISQIA